MFQIIWIYNRVSYVQSSQKDMVVELFFNASRKTFLMEITLVWRKTQTCCKRTQVCILLHNTFAKKCNTLRECKCFVSECKMYCGTAIPSQNICKGFLWYHNTFVRECKCFPSECKVSLENTIIRK